MDLDKAQFDKYGDILYTDELNFSDASDTQNVSIIYFTTDAGMIGTTTSRISARHVRTKRLLIRGQL